MLHWPHSLYNRLKWGGMCAATCSMWWLGWILHKTAQLEGGYQSGGTWSTGAALVSPPTEKKEEKKKQALSCAPMAAMVVISIFFSLSLSFSIFQGQPSLTSYKANRAVWTWGGIRVNTGCCDVCGEWVAVCGGHSWYWACGAIFFFLPGEMFWEVWSPTQGSPVEPWQLNKWLPLLLTATFDPWALSCPDERACLRSLPGSITSSPLEQLKRLAV